MPPSFFLTVSAVKYKAEDHNGNFGSYEGVVTLCPLSRIDSRKAAFLDMDSCFPTL